MYKTMSIAEAPYIFKIKIQNISATEQRGVE